MAKDKVDILYLELVGQGESGFYVEGTQNTPYAQTLTAPTITWIPTDGIEVYLDKDANGKEYKRQRPIRHIKNCENIYPIDQEKMGFKPNRMNDKIPIEHNYAAIPREGNTIQTYDYLTKSTYFLDNPLRPDNIPALFKQIKVNEKAVELLDDDELLTKAKIKVYSLRVNIGAKEYRYDEEKIKSYAKLLNVTADTPEQMLIVILQRAIQNPKAFLELIVKAENTVLTEVTHALHYNVIMFEGNTAQYTEESKLITNFGAGKFSDSRKIEALANYFQTSEGNNALTELRAKLELAKEKDFQK
ncbi:MAG: hypothetical protein ABI091_26795 [Ferruginibacter sp.]